MLDLPVDTFEILGIGAREDSYTDLLVRGLNEIPDFMENLINNLPGNKRFKYDQVQQAILRGNTGFNYKKDWKAISRIGVTIQKPEGRSKDTPDMVLYSQTDNSLIIIENKVFSGEGWQQTERYSQNEFIQKLLERLKSDPFRVNFKNPKLGFYYLTLDGTEPSCKKFFEVLRYGDIIKAIPLNLLFQLPNPITGVLLKEFYNRVSHYDRHIQSPIPGNTTVEDYLKKTSGFVTQRDNFHNICRKMEICKNMNINLTPSEGCTANQGCGSIPLFIWRKEDWAKISFDTSQNQDYKLDIHFELQWNSCTEHIVLYLHFHTKPYITAKTFQSKFPNQSQGNIKYNDLRKELYDYLNKALMGKKSEWVLNQQIVNGIRPLFVARYEYNNGSESWTCGEFKTKTEKLIDEMTGYIESFVNSSLVRNIKVP